MATQITVSADIQNVSYAVNGDATLRWAVYERLQAGVPSIFVQRDTGGGFPGQAGEVEILVEGKLPKITFDSVAAKWVILYTLIENVFYITFDENEVPLTQPAQIGDTATDHFRSVGITDDGDIGGRRTMSERIATFGPIGVRTVDAYNGPSLFDSVDIGASPNPGKVVLRFRPRVGQFLSILTPSDRPIAGYEILQRNEDRTLVRFVGLIPHLGEGVLHEAEIDGTPGEYFVRQVNKAGPHSSNLRRDRFGNPSGLLKGDGTTLEDVVQSILLGTGIYEGQAPQLLSVINTAPIVIIPPADPFLYPALGEGTRGVLESSLAVQNFGQVSPHMDETSALLYPALGRGRRLSFAQTGFGSGIIT